jgi:dTDP-4-amino-4,6-dideoxygalactose transaminase
MDELGDIARHHDLTVIEDACEAVGAEYKGRKIGSIGQAGVFAFYPNKQMTTGEGGMVVTNDDRWAEMLKSLRNQGRDEMGTWLRHVRLGFNYRLGEMSAALGVAQLERIEDLLEKRASVAGRYCERLRRVPGVRTLTVVPSTTRMSWFVYTVRLAPEIDRERVIALLDQAGIPSRSYFSPIHLQPLYRERFGYREGELPVAERVGRQILAIPFHGSMTDEQIEIVCEALTQAVTRASG